MNATAFKCVSCGEDFATPGLFATHVEDEHRTWLDVGEQRVSRSLGLPVDDDDDDDDDDEADDRTPHLVAMRKLDELVELRRRAGRFIAERNELGLEKIVVRLDELGPLFSARAKLYEKAASEAAEVRRMVDWVRRDACQDPP